MEHRTIMLVLSCFSLVNIGSLQNSTEIEINSERAFYGGDILLTPAQRAVLEETSGLLPSQRAVTIDRQALWIHAQVPYVLDSSLSVMAKVAIANAISNYKKRTCVRFVPRTNEEDYVRFYKGDGCFSMVGRAGGQQDISIGPGCEIPGIVMHEMFHTLGRWHEHSRPDRDLYVKIQFENVVPGAEVNFDKLSQSMSTTQGIMYDFDSLMHYLPNAFSTNGKVTVLPLDRSVDLSRLGQRIDFSQYDLQHVNTLYCSDGTFATWGPWGSWTPCSQTCNGGVRIRIRVCGGGRSNCIGSNIDTEQCNTAVCPAVSATWGPWGAWSSCSASCGGGRQQRSRTCIGGNVCEGPSTQFGDCNTKFCASVPTWSAWGAWSSCSSTCGKGKQRRTRICVGGSNSSTCQGSDTEVVECNIQNCTAEPLKVVNRGCYYLSLDNVKLDALEGSTPDLSDNPRNRMGAIAKCQNAAQQFGFTMFAVCLGYCISGSSRLSDYQLKPAGDNNCHNGLGGRASGGITMDVYQIVGERQLSDAGRPRPLLPINATGLARFHDSADAIDVQGSSEAHHHLPLTSLVLLLLVCVWL